MTLYILGRQPKLALAELESLCGHKSVQPQDLANVTLVDSYVNLNRLGGSVKACEVIKHVDTTDLAEIKKIVEKDLIEIVTDIDEGKINFGISLHGFSISVNQLNKHVLSLKTAIKKIGRSVRAVPNNELSLSSAQVIHNKLTGPRGIEILIIRNSEQTIIARTIAEQNIESYNLRDRGRPKRDARIGMLPPKLAQIMINLAGYQLEQAPTKSNARHKRILDPFCGTGVIPQEASLIGYDVYGTDIEERMVNYSQENLNWLGSKLNQVVSSTLQVGDATSYTWQQPIDLIVSETYLGRPFTAPPSQQILSQTVNDCNLIMKKFLRNLHGQLKPGIRLCLAVPAWQVKTGFRHLPMLDDLDNLGYNHIDFEHANQEDLIYHRTGQIVARELLVLTRK